MGLLRILLALSVVAAHLGPICGLKFFDGGVMSVESFYLISGFYMALVLSTRYAGRPRDFYFNRFLRIFPVYWMLLAMVVVLAGLYWLLRGYPLGALAGWNMSFSGLQVAGAIAANLGIFGTDFMLLYSNVRPGSAADLGGLVVIQPTWSLAVELGFYLLAPFILRLGRLPQLVIFTLALGIRYLIWRNTGSQWTPWLYYFAPASWVLFMGGVMAYHLLAFMRDKAWFKACAIPTGWALAGLLILLITNYITLNWLTFQDWRYYTLFALSLPFVFTATKDTAWDNTLGAWSYPVYLGHCAIISLYAPLRHFVPPAATVYAVLLLTAAVVFPALYFDEKIQRRFKRRISASQMPTPTQLTALSSRAADAATP
jgi:peptidoglycan/LPS O-acetylase OafA/YrhL